MSNQRCVLIISFLTAASFAYLYPVPFASSSATDVAGRSFETRSTEFVIPTRPGPAGFPYLSFSEPIDLVPQRPSATEMLVPLSLAQTDLNEDGVPDVIAGSASASGGILRLCQAAYDEMTDFTSLNETGTVTTDLAPALLATGDFNGDAHQDVIVADKVSRHFVFLAGDGKGKLRSQTVTTPGPVRAALVADLPRRDGHDDLVIGVGGQKLLIYDRWESGFTAVPQTIHLPAEVVSLDLARVNQDYVMDLVIGLEDRVVVLYGSDTKRFALGNTVGARRYSILPMGPGVVRAAVDDFTGDRQWDLVVQRRMGEFLLYPNLGLDIEAVGEPDEALPARFSSEPAVVTGIVAEPVQVVAGIFDGDRAHDLALLDRAGRQVVMVRGNQLTAEFEPPAMFSLQGEPVAMLRTRLNADARDDLLVLDNDGRLSVLLSLPAGLRQPTGQSPESAAEALPWADPTVTKTADTNDGVCDADCSLREAIVTANAGAGPQMITFNIPITDPGFANGVFTLQLTLGQLPGLTNINGTYINGQSQMAFTGPTNGNHPVIVIDGTGPAMWGFILGTDSNAVRRVQLILFVDPAPGDTNSGVVIPGGSNNIVIGSYFGVLVDTTGNDYTVSNTYGVLVNAGGQMNTIGGTNPAHRNLITGTYCVRIDGDASVGNTVLGNFIGTDPSGTEAGGAEESLGVWIDGSPGNTIGGTVAGARNIISDCDDYGIYISGVTATGNLVAGNFIGTDLTGTIDLGESAGLITNGIGNTIGGTSAGARNVISGHSDSNVQLSQDSFGNLVAGNFIGTDVTGTSLLGSSFSSVTIRGSSNTIGGSTPGARNIISCDLDGVRIAGDTATGNLVLGNYIGTDVTGTMALGGGKGVSIRNGTLGNVIGGTDPGSGNLISGNTDSGIFIEEPETTGNMVLGNFIGTDVSGTAALANNRGVEIDGAPGNVIGGTEPGAGNVISGNTDQGVYIHKPTASGNQVLGNLIGTDVTGGFPLGNGDAGVRMFDAPDTTVGGTSPGTRNVISANIGGIMIGGSASTGTAVLGNYIGTEVDGVSPLGNIGFGVLILALAGNNSVGGMTPGAGNVIAYNEASGVEIYDGVGNLIRSNSIHDNSELGINLGLDSITPNDLMDPDTGANNLQNYPLLMSASSSGGTTTITGSLNSTPSRSFTLEFFVNDPCNLSGSGEGETPLGTHNVTTDGSGDVAFSATLPVSVSAGQYVTATATDDTTNDTSEFSSCVQATSSACTLTCPANITVDNDAGECGATVTYPAPTTSGICGTVTCAPPSGSFFNVGTTPVTCTETGGAVCSFTVTVNDAEPPTVSCPANMSATGDPCAVVTYMDPAGMDNCPGVVTTCAPPSGTCFPSGVTTVTCTVTDLGGNSASCTFTVSVNPPCTITCPANITVSNDAGQCGATVAYPAPTTAGSCGTVTCTPSSGSFFNIGTTTVTCTTTVGEMCSFTVTVNDTEPPALTCPGNIALVAGASCNAVATYMLTVSDNCPGVTASCSPPSGSTFPLGVTTVSCMATDTAGNNASCSFTVTVTNSPPTVDAGPDQLVDDGSAVTLSGTGGDPDAGQMVSFQWTQTGGPPVVLTGANTATAGFTAPVLTTLDCVQLSFDLKVTDSCGVMVTDTVVVTVSDVFILQDERNGNCVTVRRTCTGGQAVYCWRTASGQSISGPCTLSVQGFTINAQSTLADPNLFQGVADFTRKTGSARLTVPRGSRNTYTIFDVNITNSTCNCP